MLIQKNHSTLLLLIITLSIFCFLYQRISTNEKLKLDNYNTYLIAIDSLRYDRTLNKAITPNISSLKSEKNVVTFHDHHIGVPRTFPSWVEMLNGKYSPRTGIRHMFPAMPVRRSQTIGLNHYLSKLKYTNSVVSDFAGDIFPRFNGGYDFIKTPNLTLDILILTGIDLSFPLFLPLMTSPLGLKFFEHLKGSPNFADPKRLVGTSKELIKNVDSLHFMTIFFSTAHFPYAASWPWYTKFTDKKYSGPFYFQKSPNLISEENISPSDIKQVRSLYNGSIASIDDAIGKFITWLKEHNLYDKSLIIITADHGEDLYENNLSQGHGEHLIGENVTKVPLIIKFPSPVEIQTKNIYFTSRSVDIMPTVLSILGKKVNAIDGVDLSQWVLNGESPKPPLKAYSETGLWFTKKGRSFFQKKRLLYPGVSQMLNFDPGGTGDIILRPDFEPIVVTAKHRSLVFENFKLIYIPDHHGVKFSLYDRFKDPDNKIDIKDKFPKKFLELKESLKNMVSNMEVTYKNVDGYWIKM